MLFKTRKKISQPVLKVLGSPPYLNNQLGKNKCILCKTKRKQQFFMAIILCPIFFECMPSDLMLDCEVHVYAKIKQNVFRVTEV